MVGADAGAEDAKTRIIPIRALKYLLWACGPQMDDGTAVTGVSEAINQPALTAASRASAWANADRPTIMDTPLRPVVYTAPFCVDVAHSKAAPSRRTHVIG